MPYDKKSKSSTKRKKPATISKRGTGFAKGKGLAASGRRRRKT